MRIAGRPKCASTPGVVSAFQYGSKSGHWLPPNPTPASCTSSGACRRVTPATTGCQTCFQDEISASRLEGRRRTQVSPRLVGQLSTRAHDSKASITVSVAIEFQWVGRAAYDPIRRIRGFGGADGNHARRIVPRVVGLGFLGEWSDPPDAGRAFATDCRSDPTFRLRRARRRPAERKVSTASQWLRPPRRALRCEACGCTNRRS